MSNLPNSIYSELEAFKKIIDSCNEEIKIITNKNEVFKKLRDYCDEQIKTLTNSETPTKTEHTNQKSKQYPATVDMSEVTIADDMVLEVRSAMNGVVNSQSDLISYLMRKINIDEFSLDEKAVLNTKANEAMIKMKHMMETFEKEDEIVGEGPR